MRQIFIAIIFVFGAIFVTPALSAEIICGIEECVIVGEDEVSTENSEITFDLLEDWSDEIEALGDLVEKHWLHLKPKIKSEGNRILVYAKPLGRHISIWAIPLGTHASLGLTSGGQYVWVYYAATAAVYTYMHLDELAVLLEYILEKWEEQIEDAKAEIDDAIESNIEDIKDDVDDFIERHEDDVDKWLKRQRKGLNSLLKDIF